MAQKQIDLTGVHFVRRSLSGGRDRWHVYAWRGGPQIMTADQVLKPALTPAAVAGYLKAHEDTPPQKSDTFAALVEAFLASPKYLSLADYTKRDYRRWLDRAKDEFKGAKIKFFDDPKFRADIIAWRDKWSHSPRQASYALQVLSIALAWGAERGWLTTNPVKLISKDYSADRAEIVWTDAEIDAVASHMQPHVARAFRLASWTGLARGDLVALRWNEVGDLYISRKRNKTGVETVIPLFDQTRALLAEFKAAAKSAGVTPVFVVANRWGKPFASTGFATAVHRAHKAAGVAAGKTLHDVRGTFATRLMDAGFTDSEINEVMGWETGKSQRIRRTYISRRNVVISAIKRMRDRTKKERSL